MVRMKRIKEQDWTRVLQERLQDARLPLEDGWASSSLAGPKTLGNPGQPSEKSGDGPNRPVFPGRWWPWALAGVAAAAIAAFLLLRPAVNPAQTPDRLAQETQTSSQNAGQAEPVVLLPQSDRSRPADGVTEERQPSPRTRPTAPDGAGKRAQANAHPAHRLPQEDPSTKTAQNVDGGAKNEVPSTKQAQFVDGEENNEGLSTKIAQNVDGNSEGPTLAELALADLEEIPEEPVRPRRKLAGRVSLRVQAATAGTSFSGGVNPKMPTSQLAFGKGKWVVADDYDAADSYMSNIGNAAVNGDGLNQPNSPNVEWLYVQVANEHEMSVMSVPKAPALPVTFGVSLSLPLSRSWVLSAGLDYMQRDGYRLYGDTPQSLTLHYLGIPVDAQYYFNPESRWRFYLGAGVHAAKCIAATGGQPLRDPVLFSGNVMAGTDIRLFPGVRFYLTPVLSAPFNRSAYVNSWDDKLQFQLRVGLSFDLK